jgi:hypothetical protein
MAGVELEAENQWLKEQFKLARHRRFGASSEKTSAIVQTELVFNEVEVTLDSTPIEPEPRTITYARKPKQAGHREKMLADLPVEVIEAASIRLRSWTVSRDICTPVPEYFGADGRHAYDDVKTATLIGCWSSRKLSGSEVCRCTGGSTGEAS